MASGQPAAILLGMIALSHPPWQCVGKASGRPGRRQSGHFRRQ